VMLTDHRGNERTYDGADAVALVAYAITHRTAAAKDRDWHPRYGSKPYDHSKIDPSLPSSPRAGGFVSPDPLHVSVGKPPNGGS
jgi:hypothetical protein